MKVHIERLFITRIGYRVRLARKPKTREGLTEQVISTTFKLKISGRERSRRAGTGNKIFKYYREGREGSASRRTLIECRFQLKIHKEGDEQALKFSSF